ncbi:early nodulin-12A-like [Lotus japonicus]|uniref:early nodulin-12A-like n=1 Tax=Lotus japonicus TaxID=34305 RepID=UPI00258C58FE|nr:early nodulin-12A-like [Lotus japonicus]
MASYFLSLLVVFLAALILIPQGFNAEEDFYKHPKYGHQPIYKKPPHYKSPVYKPPYKKPPYKKYPPYGKHPPVEDNTHF